MPDQCSIGDFWSHDLEELRYWPERGRANQLLDCSQFQSRRRYSRIKDKPETIATWTLEGSGGKTRVTIVQSGFAPDRNNEDYFIGWSKFALRLKTMLEEGPGWNRVRVFANRERSEAMTMTIDPAPNQEKGARNDQAIGE